MLFYAFALVSLALVTGSTCVVALDYYQSSDRILSILLFAGAVLASGALVLTAFMSGKLKRTRVGIFYMALGSLLSV